MATLTGRLEKLGFLGFLSQVPRVAWGKKALAQEPRGGSCSMRFLSSGQLLPDLQYPTMTVSVAITSR
jgi:hypothetical protein